MSYLEARKGNTATCPDIQQVQGDYCTEVWRYKSGISQNIEFNQFKKMNS